MVETIQGVQSTNFSLFVAGIMPFQSKLKQVAYARGKCNRCGYFKNFCFCNIKPLPDNDFCRPCSKPENVYSPCKRRYDGIAVRDVVKKEEDGNDIVVETVLSEEEDDEVVNMPNIDIAAHTETSQSVSADQHFRQQARSSSMSEESENGSDDMSDRERNSNLRHFGR